MRRLLACVLFAAVLVAGCGGSTTHTTDANTTTNPASTPNPASALQQAARSAVLANNRLSIYVLWNNQIPSWASQSTAGPALAELRSSAATRRTRGIRIKLLSAQYQVLSIQLDPSYETATVIIRDRGRVLPYEPGRAPGRSITFNEHARLELHRVGSAPRFVVWRLVSIP